MIEHLTTEEFRTLVNRLTPALQELADRSHYLRVAFPNEPDLYDDLSFDAKRPSHFASDLLTRLYHHRPLTKDGESSLLELLRAVRDFTPSAELKATLSSFLAGHEEPHTAEAATEQPRTVWRPGWRAAQQALRPEIVVAFAPASRDQAELLARHLLADGYQVWLDLAGFPADAAWLRPWEQALADACALLVIVTPQARVAGAVQELIALARAQSTPPHPLILTPCADQTGVLASLHLADHAPFDFASAGWEAGYRQLRQVLPPTTPPTASTGRVAESISLAPAAPRTPTNRLLDPARVYCWQWFGQSWARVSLADIASREEQVSLVDTYVALQVDHGVTIKTERGQVVDWWTGEVAERASERELHHPLQSRRREWTALGVNEAGVQTIVEELQRQRPTPNRVRDAEERRWPLEAISAARLQRHLVLLGDPGSGKSSFVRHLALCLAGEQLRAWGEIGVPPAAGLAAIPGWQLGPYTPLYIELRDLVAQAFAPLPTNRRDDPPAPTRRSSGTTSPRGCWVRGWRSTATRWRK